MQGELAGKVTGMNRYLLVGLMLGLTVSGALGGDLYKVRVANEADARLLRQTGATGLVIVTDGFLVLTDSVSRERLESTSLNIKLLATGVAREELAFDASLAPTQVGRFLSLYRDGNLRVCRVPAQMPEDETGHALFCPINPNGVEIRYLKSEQSAQELLRRLQPLGVSLDSLIVRVSQDSLIAYASELESFGPRSAGSTADSLAGFWLASRFHDLGYDSVVVDTVAIYVGLGLTYHNVAAYKIGSRFPNHQIIIGAHYDSGDPSPGADDDASGCAGVLELARILRNVETDLTIVLVLFDAEELQMVGSSYFARERMAIKDSILYMLNLDMIGFQDNVDSVKVHHGTQTELSQLWIQLADSLVGIKGVMSGQRAADQLPFAEMGIEVSFIIEHVFNTHYHTARDSTTYLNFPYMTRLVKASLATAYTVAATAKPRPVLAFDFPDGRPLWFSPGRLDSFDVTIRTSYGGAVLPGTPALHCAFNGQPYDTNPLIAVGVDRYRAALTTDTCSSVCTFTATAQDSTGRWFFSSVSDTTPHRALVTNDYATLLADNFETDRGWSVAGMHERRYGGWERGAPAGSGLRGDPTSDYDGSGQCYLTGNGPGDTDVYGGYAYLTSPVFSLLGREGLIHCAVWFSNYKGYPSFNSPMRIRLSNDSGLTWATVKAIQYGPPVTGDWFEYEFLTRDILPETDKMLLRFDVYNQGYNEIVEAAVDDVRILGFRCDTSSCCRGNTGNVNLVGMVDLSDLSALISFLTGGGYVLPCPAEANVNGTGIVDLSDLSALVSYLTGGGYLLPICM